MKIFDKRPLCMILCILLGGFVFFTDCILLVKVTVTCLAVAALIVIWGFFRKNPHKIIATVSIASLLTSSLFSFLYFDCYFNVYDHYGDRVEIVATVKSSTNTDYGASVYLECESINGNSRSNKIYAYIPTDCVDGVENYSRVHFTAILKDFEENGDYQDRGNMRSMGYSAEAYEVADFHVLSYTSASLPDLIAEYRIGICNYIIDYSGAEGGGLLCALLLGERDYLPFQSALSFKRCGLSHMLALSGLHLTIITFALSFALSLLKIRKKPRKVIEIIFVLLYSALTGMPISVVRAALMHIIASLIFLCAAKSDSITSLSISVGIICVIMPYAIYDISLWLSAFATLGVLVYSEMHGGEFSAEKPKLIKRLFSGMVGGIVVSLFAIGTTYLISTLSFGEISLIGAFTTPIASFFITPFMYLGLIFLIVAAFIPLGVAVNIYGAFICKIIQSFSSINGIYISAEDVLTVSLVALFTISVILFLLLDIKKKKYPLLILLALYISSNVSAFTVNIINCSSDDFIYFCDQEDEYFLIKSNNKTYFIDVSSQSVSDSYSAINHVYDDGITEISTYICTSYNDNTVCSVLQLASSIHINEIYLPSPSDWIEKSAYETLDKELSGSYTELKEYTSSSILELGSYKAIFPYRSTLENKCAFLVVDPSNYITCYTSSGMLESNTKAAASEVINGSDRLILGCHGKSYYEFNFILKFDGLDEIIVSNENINIPGEVLDYYGNSDVKSSSERMNLKR